MQRKARDQNWQTFIEDGLDVEWSWPAQTMATSSPRAQQKGPPEELSPRASQSIPQQTAVSCQDLFARRPAVWGGPPGRLCWCREPCPAAYEQTGLAGPVEPPFPIPSPRLWDIQGNRIGSPARTATPRRPASRSVLFPALAIAPCTSRYWDRARD